MAHRNPILDTDIQFGDNSTGNANQFSHGFMPKLPEKPTQILSGSGQWIDPTVPGSGGQGVIGGFVADIASLQAFSGVSTLLTVYDSLAGGVFYYTTAALTADNGIVFAATGKGTGFWVRIFNKVDGVRTSWFLTTVDDTASSNNTKINAAITYAQANSIKKVIITGLIRLDSGTGAIFNLTMNGLEIHGEGMNDTVITYPNVAINAATQIFTMAGNDQVISNIKFVNLSQSGSNDLQVITATAFRPIIRRCQGTGVYGNGTAGGAAISAFMAWNGVQYTTTLGTTFGSGAQTATPASMAGIHIGSQLHIAGTAEDVVVTAITQTTFTATFVNAHTNTDVVTIYSQGFQGGLIEDCWFHDSWKCSAIVVNSSGNVIRRCFVENIGSATTQHGIYIQGGNNDVVNCYIKGISGYGIHGHKAVANIDSSGDRYVNNTIGDCRQCAIIVDSTNNGTLNTQIPNTTALNRYNLIQGNTFRNSLGFLPSSALPTLDIQASSRIVDNEFEDTYTTANESVIFSAAASGSTFIGNRMSRANTTTGTTKAVRTSVANVVIEDNDIDFGSSQIVANEVTWSNNRIIDGTLKIDGNDVRVMGNTSKNATLAAYDMVNTHSNIVLDSNELITSSTAIFCNLDFTNLTNITFRNNKFPGATAFLRYTNPNATVNMIGNQGGLSQGGQAVMEQTVGCGRANMYQFGASAGIVAGNVLKLVGGVLVKVTTTDTVFDGIATSDLPSGASSCFVVGNPGTVVRVLCTGAWTAGNYAIISTTVAGTLKDGGSYVPTIGYSYGKFLDTGGGTGTATVLLSTVSSDMNLGASIVANSAAINTTDTLIVKTPAIPANRLQVGTTIRVTLMGTCTSTGTGTSNFNIHIGTNGTVADGLMQQAVTPAAAASGTSIPFKVMFEITIRTVGASATSHGYCTLMNTGITGLSATQGPSIILPTFTNFDSTIANMIISASYQAAAATTTCTFNDAIIEIIYK